VKRGQEWYRAYRLRAIVEEERPREGIYSVLGLREQALARRWSDITAGQQEYVSLDLADRLLTALDLHLWMLGEPDYVTNGATPRRGAAQLELAEAA
jgi:hypothetical protein